MSFVSSVQLVLVSLLACASVAGAQHARMDQKHRAMFETYCIECHGEKVQKGKVRLDTLSFEIADIPAAERWQKILNQINSGEMPPEDATPLPAEVKAAFLESLSKQMVVARKALADTGGTVIMRRLNRREYVHTLHELLGVEVEPEGLPVDEAGGSFDTIGSALFFSSDQFENYLKNARKALDNALFVAERPAREMVRYEPEEGSNKSRRADLKRAIGRMRNIAAWRRSGNPASDFGLKIVDEEEARAAEGLTRSEVGRLEAYLNDPATARGVFVTPWPYPVTVEIPSKAAPGKYILRVRLGYPDETMTERKFIEFGKPSDRGWAELDLLGCREVRGTLEKPETLELPVVISKTGGRSFGIRDRQHNSSEGVEIQNWWGKKYSGGEYSFWRGLWVDWVEWEGPFVEEWPPTTYQKVLGDMDLQANPGEEQAKQILERFAERAFRGRPVRPEFIQALVSQYAERRAAGESFLEAIKTPLSIVLASPAFLYIVEPVERSTEPADVSRTAAETDAKTALQSPSRVPLSGVELANRLSYFLWSSPPDDLLLSYASAGQLHGKTTGQIDRLLNNPRVMRFISGFAHQWLDMARLDFFQFNPRLYPKFDASARASARQEVYETIRYVLKHDLPLGTLLKSDFVVVNDVMADYYGIQGVSGSVFRKVPVPSGMPRGGLLGTAAVLAMGSDGERSSLVERGAWVLRKLLHDPPPPAPANVPMLSRFAGKLMPAREVMTAHQQQPQCAQCHRRIDPIGFALEHFDAAGNWREEEYTDYYTFWKAIQKKATFPINAQGHLPDGTAFEGFEGLRDAVARHEENFVRGLTESLLEYALGRPYSFSDQDLVEDILKKARASKFTLRSIVYAIVASKEFASKQVR
jgi:hypothetical protein